MRNTVEDGPKRAVRATLVKVLLHSRTDRGMSLLEWAGRCVRAGEVHELVVTDQWDPVAGARIDRVGFLGFAEMECGGVVDRGDVLRIGDIEVGPVLGFDGCHFPNHYNILVHNPVLMTGASLDLRPESPVVFGGQQTAGEGPKD
ncbi:DUF6917 domain-containing protein [Streptomyces sp. NPDC002476]|uniref:DUF6917 domain-containing protein n=1 Tax=Streptomyces sp. NPDC002476 TaxID=3364648 RepID=UPI0036ACC485